jgi:hypothetical protein
MGEGGWDWLPSSQVYKVSRFLFDLGEDWDRKGRKFAPLGISKSA